MNNETLFCYGFISSLTHLTLALTFSSSFGRLGALPAEPGSVMLPHITQAFDAFVEVEASVALQ
jgi:hypothetical protein